MQHDEHKRVYWFRKFLADFLMHVRRAASEAVFVTLLSYPFLPPNAVWLWHVSRKSSIYFLLRSYFLLECVGDVRGCQIMSWESSASCAIIVYMSMI